MQIRKFKGDPVVHCEGQITEYARELSLIHISEPTRPY